MTTDKKDKDDARANRYHQRLGAKWMTEAIVTMCRTTLRENRNAQEFANDIERSWENEEFWRPAGLVAESSVERLFSFDNHSVARCDTPGCGRDIPPGGEGHPQICPVCLACLAMHQKDAAAAHRAFLRKTEDDAFFDALVASAMSGAAIGALVSSMAHQGRTEVGREHDEEAFLVRTHALAVKAAEIAVAGRRAR